MVDNNKKAYPQIKARVPQHLVDRINDFRHANKIDTRNDAIEKLIELGLGAAENAHSNKDETPSSNNTNDDASHARPA